MIPSEWAGSAPVASRSPGSSVDQMIRPSGEVRMRASTRPNSSSCTLGFER
jgi:hypothetical protein